MNAGPLHPLAQLADELKFYWSLLRTSVRLDRAWHANLTAQHFEAHTDALILGQRVAHGDRKIDSLGDLREFLLERIQGTTSRMKTLLPATDVPAEAMDLVRSVLSEVGEIMSLLVRGMDVRENRCTADRVARRQLARWLAGRNRATQMVQQPAELTTLACAEAERRLQACIGALEAAEEIEPALAARLH